MNDSFMTRGVLKGSFMTFGVLKGSFMTFGALNDSFMTSHDGSGRQAIGRCGCRGS
jgi:hypothetical protein